MIDEHIKNLTATKNASYIAAALLGLSIESYLILGILMVLDTIGGVMKSYVLYGGYSIKSYKLSSGIISKLTIIGIPVIVAWAGRGVGLDFIGIAKAILGMLILSELYSILGNAYSIRIGKEIEEFDAVGFVIGKARDIIERIIKNK